MKEDIKKIYKVLEQMTDSNELEKIINPLYNTYTGWNQNSLATSKFSGLESQQYSTNIKNYFKKIRTTHSAWQIVDFIRENECIIRKKEKERIISKADIAKNQLIQLGSIISFELPCLFMETDSYFLHLRGNFIEGDNDCIVLRYYLNLNPNYGLDCLKLIYHSLNKYQIPFHLKCIINPNEYIRKDNLVIYTSRTYIHIVNEIFRYKYEQIKGYLNREKVLFTKELYAGISYAESPLNNQSFGYTKCRDIALAYIGLKTKTLENLISKLITMGYDINNFHHNPYSFFMTHNEL